MFAYFHLNRINTGSAPNIYNLKKNTNKQLVRYKQIFYFCDKLFKLF